jgi:hypothetical protein
MEPPRRKGHHASVARVISFSILVAPGLARRPVRLSRSRAPPDSAW